MIIYLHHLVTLRFLLTLTNGSVAVSPLDHEIGHPCWSPASYLMLCTVMCSNCLRLWRPEVHRACRQCLHPSACQTLQRQTYSSPWRCFGLGHKLLSFSPLTIVAYNILL